MNEKNWLVEQFEERRSHLQGVAYRMLGSLAEADDAVQAAWLRLSRADTKSIENMSGWLTTVVARVCLDMLRSRRSRKEESLDNDDAPEPNIPQEASIDPEREALLADTVGLALLVVLDKLEPAERLAFVLHDLFAVSFNEIAPIVGRTTTTTRQLASRARRRVRGAANPDPDVTRQREVVNAFLAASRAGNFDALLTLLDPDVVFKSDMPAGALDVLGADSVAKRFARRGNARATQAALVNGTAGIVVAPQGRLFMVIRLTLKDGKIVEIDAVSEPAQLEQLELAVFE